MPCAAGDGNGCAIAYRDVTYRAAADGHSAAVPIAGEAAFVISNPAALNRQGTFYKFEVFDFAVAAPLSVIYDGQVAVGGINDSALLVRNRLAHSEIIHRPAVQVERQGFLDNSQSGILARFDVAPNCRMVCQQLDGVAVLRRVQCRREGCVCTAIRAVRFCYRSGLNDSLVDCEFRSC